ncbi:AIR carboxylase family protein [Candidatus Pacearchaeota archaeon]|nr:AIR carboxylase family protein [Candidatus Pacearchaeota archaeon]
MTLDYGQIDIEFENRIKSKLGCAVIIAGSGSDGEHVEKIVKSLGRYNIPNLARVCSAHKQPKEIMNIVEAYNSVAGSMVFVAVAGGIDSLSGILSYLSLHPVISCPPDGLKNDSCFRNPSGSSNATIYEPENVGRFVAQMYSGVNDEIRGLLSSRILIKSDYLKQDDSRFQGRIFAWEKNK